jgi:putative endonuclease
VAAAYLTARGLRILDSNYRFRGGEIDLVADDEGTLCFVEVRSRGATLRGSALETIGPKKQARIARCAEHYLVYRRKGAPCPCRFDVVAVDEGRVTWIRDAFRARW